MHPLQIHLFFLLVLASAQQFLVSGGANVQLLKYADKKITKVAETANALGSWLTLSGDATRFYLSGENTNSTSAYTFVATGPSAVLGPTVASGYAPVHNVLSIDQSWLYSSAYGDGIWVAYKLDKTGAFQAGQIYPVYMPNPVTPGDAPFNVARAHLTVIDPTGQFAVIMDLGADSICIMQLFTTDAAHSSGYEYIACITSPKKNPSDSANGPRHAVFSNGGTRPRLHIVNERMNTVDTFVACYSSKKLVLTPEGASTITVKDNTNPKLSAAAEILVSKNQKYLLVSNRPQPENAATPDYAKLSAGSIAVLEITDSKETPLVQKAIVSSGGKNPRSMTLNQAGNLLVVTNQGDGNPDTAADQGISVAVFEFDQATGVLSSAPVASYKDFTAPQSAVFVEKRELVAVKLDDLSKLAC